MQPNYNANRAKPFPSSCGEGGRRPPVCRTGRDEKELTMTQKKFKKVAALIMGIPRNGWSASKCGSPLIMQAAFAATASSKKIASSGSAVRAIFSSVENKSEYASIFQFVSVFQSVCIGLRLS